jgi:MFS family permease
MTSSSPSARESLNAPLPSFWTLVVLLIGIQTTGSLCTTTLPAIAPEVAGALGVPSRLIGYQISLLAAAMLISLAFGGATSRRYGACRITQVAATLIGAGIGVCAYPHLLAAALGTILMGLGYGLLTPSASHLLMRFTPVDRRNVVFSIKQTGVPLGAIVAASVQPAVAIYLGWQYALGLAAGIAFLMVALLQRHRAVWDDDRDPTVRTQAAPFAGIGIVWRDRALRYMSVSGGLLVVAQICVSTFTVVMFAEDVGYSLVAAGFVLTVSQVGGVAGRIFWGWTADRWGNCIATLLTLCFIMALGTALCAFVDRSWPLLLVYALFFVLGSTASGWNGAFLAEVARLSPTGHVGSATGGSLFFVNCGKMIGPIFVTQAYVLAGSYSLAFASIALPSLLAFAFLAAAGRIHAARAAVRV